MVDRATLPIGIAVRRWSTRGGTEKYAFDLCHALRLRGRAVVVFCAEVCAPTDGIDVRPLRRSAWGGLVRREAWVRGAAQIPRQGMAALWSFDRIPGVPLHRAGGGVHATWLAARDGDRSAWRRAVSMLADRRELVLERDTFALARGVVFNSPSARDDALARGLVTAERSQVLRNGVDLQRFSPNRGARAELRRDLDVDAAARVALFLGNGFHRKGFDVAWRAFAAVASARDRFVVVGDDRGAEWKQAAAQLGDQLRWVGSTAHPERWFGAADAVIHPTRYDSAANVVLEALACGVPVITSGADGNADRIPDRRLVVDDARDRLGFAEALRYAWSGSGLSAEALRAAVEPWTVAGNAEAFEAISDEWG